MQIIQFPHNCGINIFSQHEDVSKHSILNYLSNNILTISLKRTLITSTSSEQNINSLFQSLGFTRTNLGENFNTGNNIYLFVNNNIYKFFTKLKELCDAEKITYNEDKMKNALELWKYRK